MNPHGPDEFETLFKRYYPRVVQLFLRQRFSKETARDLAQTTFLRVFTYWEGYRREAEWDWIRTIAQSVASNEWRARKTIKRDAPILDLEDSDPVPDPQTSEQMGWSSQDAPDRQILVREQVQRLYKAIEKQPPKVQRCLLQWLAGWTYAEIAKAQQLSIEAVRALLFRAKKRLRQELGDPGREWLDSKEQDHE